MAKTDLNKYVMSFGKDEKMPEQEIKKVTAQLLKSVEYLHLERKTIHRDIKPANILIFEDLNIKLSDFGLARATNPHSIADTNCGTTAYKGPQGNDSYKIDIYSVGATVWFMMNKEPPNAEDIPIGIYNFKYDYSEELKEFVKFMLK